MYWLLVNMYSEILDLGLEVFIIRVTFRNRMKRLLLEPGLGRLAGSNLQKEAGRSLPHSDIEDDRGPI